MQRKYQVLRLRFQLDSMMIMMRFGHSVCYFVVPGSFKRNSNENKTTKQSHQVSTANLTKICLFS